MDSKSMPHYDGRLIFSCEDEEGVIEVVDEPTTRTLYFGTRARQSSMFLHDPCALALAYSRCMMSCLLFVEAPQSALLLGLGGGALVRFLLHHFPACRLEVVERRARVVEVARRYFHLPRSPQLRLHAMDAAQFLNAPAAEPYDLLLVDIHDSEGMAPLVHEPNFFARCRGLLQARGMLSINLWSGRRDDALKRLMYSLRTSFERRVLLLPVAGKRNAVALGSGFALPQRPLRLLSKRALELQARFNLDFPELLRELLRVNSSLL